MHNRLVLRRTVAPILVASALILLGVVFLFSFFGSADEPLVEFRDFGVQTVAGATPTSESTSLRFIYTIGSLNYSEVGYVFSKTDPDPTIGEEGCEKYATTTVYTSIYSNGSYHSSSGRWWVAIPMMDIPQEDFDDVIYYTAYVTDGNGTRYSSPRSTSVCQELGHDYVPGLILSAPTATDPGEQEFTCSVCGDFAVLPVDLTAYNAAISTLQSQISSGFVNSDFGNGSIQANLGGSYAVPSVHPTVGQHPRVLFTSESIDGLNTALSNAKPAAVSGYVDAILDNPPNGILAQTEFDETDQSILSNIQLLALDYRMTGNRISGYRAIYAIKNVLKTLGSNWTGHDDVAHRYYGFAMYVSACVYDWCYDLMTSTDKQQIILGVQEKICKVGMTVTYAVGFPPTGADPVSGHGTAFQLLRDYLAFAIAIYDEYPGWWNMIAGRFYQEFVPVRNAFYEAGINPQGVSLYLQSKTFSDLYSAWLIKAATGTFPYASEENMMQAARTIYSYELRVNSGKLVGLSSGDDQSPYGTFLDYGHIALISSYLFDDATMRAQLEHNYQSGSNPTNQPYGSSYRNFSDTLTRTATIAEYLICSSSGLTKASDRHQGMDLILYNGGWLGQIIARNTWSRSQATVLMKIGQRTVANHDHYDAGSFQIFYKSILAGDSGVYDGYGNNHHKYYHQATIAHNSLLIYNPALSSTYSGYYSGGQRRLSDANLSNWQSDTYKTGEVTGVSYGYNGSTPTYAYIAGDIAAAYDSSVADEVTRRMLAVYDTDNSAVPLYFFVFDNITAKSASFKKTFLLHTRYEPTISGNTVIANNGSGRLVLQNVIGNNVTITPRGGSGQNYLVNSYGVNNYVQLNSPHNKDDGYWGRVEISPATGNKTDQLLNVMYVCDNNANAPSLTASAISTNVVKGAVIGNTAAIFVTSATRRASAFSFQTTGSGNLNYYVSGVEEGWWVVTVNGVQIRTAATEEGGFLTFTAPAGTVELRPGYFFVHSDLTENTWPSVSFQSIQP